MARQSPIEIERMNYATYAGLTPILLGVTGKAIVISPAKIARIVKEHNRSPNIIKGMIREIADPVMKGDETAMTFSLRFDPRKLEFDAASGINNSPDVMPGAVLRLG